MKLNDPFGRIQQKQQDSYVSLRSALLNAGVNSREGAETVLKNLLRRAWVITLLVSLATLAIVWLLPAMRAAALMIAFIILFWLLMTTLNGYRLVSRYIREDLSD